MTDSKKSRKGIGGRKPHPLRQIIWVKFGIKRKGKDHRTEVKLPLTLVEQLLRCQDPSAQALLIGKSERFNAADYSAEELAAMKP